MNAILAKYNLPDFKMVRKVKVLPNLILWDDNDLRKTLTFDEFLNFQSSIYTKDLSVFERVEEFKLNANETLSDTFFNSTSLRVLELENVKFSARAKLNLPNLEDLLLSRVKCTSLNPGIGLSTKLNRIRLWHVGFKKLPNELSALQQLKELTVYNKLETLDGITLPLSLEKLDFRSNKLENIPGEVLELPKLKFLDLSCNNFISFPTIKNSSLIEIDVWETPFGIFKKNIDQLAKQLSKATVKGGRNGKFVEDGNTVFLPGTNLYYSNQFPEGTTSSPY